MNILRTRKVWLIAAVVLTVACGLWLVADKQKIEKMSMIKTAAADTPLLYTHPINHHIRRKLRRIFIKMVIEKRLSIEDVRFNAPDQFDILSDPTKGLFHPEGGAAPYELADPQWLEEGYDGRWIYSGELALRDQEHSYYKEKNPETYEPLTEVIAFLPGVRESLCKELNEELGVEGIPQLQSDQSALYSKEIIDGKDKDYRFPEGDVTYLDNEVLENQIFGCFKSYAGNTYVYYHLLMER